jgi:hypothetical protein
MTWSQGRGGRFEGLHGLGALGGQSRELLLLLRRGQHHAFLAPADVRFMDVREERAEV